MNTESKMVISVKDENFASNSTTMGKVNLPFERIRSAIRNGNSDDVTGKAKITLPLNVNGHSASIMLT